MQKEIITELQAERETSRIEAFSDGIFCVGITLLAIEIGVELNAKATNKDLIHSLFKLWPICLAYFISFVNVLLAWIGHHGLFKNLRATDNFVMMSNGFLLMLIALAPFPTKTLGAYFQTGAFKTAVVFYTGYFVLISIAYRLLWYAASRKKELLVKGITNEKIRTVTKAENIGLICNCIIMAVAFVSPWAALILSFGMWIYWIGFQ
ncbi:MAG: TMEM175 family protein [Ferruginibacter sp.]